MLFKRRNPIFVIFLSVVSFSSFSLSLGQERREEGRFAIYFMDKEVGYETFTWRADSQGYYLEVTGRITEPIRLDTTKLAIHLDKSFIPTFYSFQGYVSGVSQRVVSTIQDGRVTSEVQVGSQKRVNSTWIRRNALLLPNAIYSPYLVITKKFRCSLQEQVELAAYIVPQLEMLFTLEPKKDSPCIMVLKMSGIEVELETDSEGNLESVLIPSQQIRVVRGD